MIVDYEKFVKLWQSGIPANDIAEKLGMTQWHVTSTAYRLRKLGVKLTKRNTKRGAYKNSISKERIDHLNKLIA